MASTRGRRAALARAVVIVLMVAAVPGRALAATDEDVEAAQRRANQAARELAEAEREHGEAEYEVAQLQAKVERIEQRVALVRDQVRELAIRLYVQGSAPLTRLLRMADTNQIVRAQQYTHVVAGVQMDSLHQYRADREDLREEISALERQQESQADALENLRREQADAVKEIDRLTALAQQARAAREDERRAQVAAATPPLADPNPTGSAAADRPAAGPVQQAAPAPAPAPEPVEEAPPPPVTGGSSDWICPVQGPLAFSDDYGAPRGGGYSHQGNDILAATGTPVVASVSGYVTHRSGAISGLAYYLEGDDGNEYFGAHLDSFGASGQVAAGTQVGTVGSTGDAAGGPPHLHFEIHPGGSGNINPYPTLSRYC